MSSGFRVPDVDLSAIQAAIVCFDSFTDTNGTSLDAHTMDHGGLTWTEQSGDWDIQSNRANGSAVYANATISTSISDLIADCTATIAANNNVAGVLLRWTDENDWWTVLAQSVTNEVQIWENNGGVITKRASASVTVNNATAYDIRGIAYGQTIDGFLDSANKISYGSATLNETATTHGIRAGNNANNKIDNFSVMPRTSSTYDSVLNGV